MQSLKTVSNVIDLIGETPMIEIHHFSKNTKVKIWAKVEGQNIGGSVKDRAALNMIQVAERSGELTKEKTIIEPTSGNTGIALAMIAAVKGYDITITMSAGMSQERKKILRAFGAKLIETPAELGTGGAIEEAKAIMAQDPTKYWMPAQHDSLENPRAHQFHTAHEILSQVPDITHFVTGMGTFGTLRGVSTTLRAEKPEVKIISVEPLFGEKVDAIRSRKEPYPSSIFDESLLDERLMITRAQAVGIARKLALTNGLLMGTSSGASLWGAVQVANQLESGTVVTLFPDRGEKYLSTDLFE